MENTKTQSARSKHDNTLQKIDLQHVELLQKLDELDKQIEAVLTEWTSKLGGEANVDSLQS